MTHANYIGNIFNENVSNQIKRENKEISFKIMLGRNMKTKPWMPDRAAINALFKVKKEIKE